MAIEFRGRIVFERGFAEAAANSRHEGPNQRSPTGPPIPIPARNHAFGPNASLRHVGTGQGPKQALTRRPGELDVPPPHGVAVGDTNTILRHVIIIGVRHCSDGDGQEAVGAQEEGGGSAGELCRRQRRRRGEEVPPLRHGQDAAVADRAVGPEDAVQRLRRKVQVGPAGTGIPARCEPDVCADEAFEFA